MAKKCINCDYCKSYVDKKGFVDRIYTVVCTKDFPNTTIIDLQSGQADESRWRDKECFKET